MSHSSYEISVCICTHNARRDYFPRVLAALATQTLDHERWELVIVDNKSQTPVSDWVDLSAIKHARIVSEPILGLTHARIRGIRTVAGEIIVFVDDDNVLDENYLKNALRIMTEKPFLGAIGGKCKGEFAAPLPSWAKFYLPYLAVADHGVNPIYIHHVNTYMPWYPYGAGMVIRRSMAEAYVEQVEASPGRKMLGRRGTSLTSAEDIDMILVIMDSGLAIGYFPDLSLTHIIPRQRLRFSYMRRLIYHSNYSLYQLMLARKIPFRPRPWPMTYITSLLLCLLHGYWHPLTLIIAMNAARGRYAAMRDFAD